ncbi:MAG: type IV secretion protein IcmV [Legionella longbeachae]|nr:type IV secretion protein IcmV [Legionella longbeachae]
MKKNSQFIKIISGIFNIRKWFDWARAKVFTLYLVNAFKRIFIPQQSHQTETFDEAVKKFHLNDENLQEKQNSLWRLTLLMLILAVLILAYAGYQLYLGSIKAFLVSLVVTLIALVLAFRYHFWYFQIKEHKLGCTISEWYRHGFLKEKK